MLEAALRAHRGAFALEAAFEVAHGETLVLVGESGAGNGRDRSAGMSYIIVRFGEEANRAGEFDRPT